MANSIVSSELRAPPNRILEWRKHRGLSQDKLGEAIGVSAQFLGQLELGKRQLTQKWMTKLARALEITPGELLPAPAAYVRKPQPEDDPPESGDFPGLDIDIPPRNARFGETPKRSTATFRIPVMGTGRGGKPGTFSLNTGEPVDFVDRPPPRLEHNTGVYVIYVEGNSMEPAHFDGDMLFIDSRRKPFPGRDALVEFPPLAEGEPPDALVKRVVQINSEFVELIEFKPKERKFRISRDKIKSLHLVLKNTDMY